MARPPLILNAPEFSTELGIEESMHDRPCWKCENHGVLYYPDGPDGEDVIIEQCEICSTPSDAYAVLPPVGFGD